MGQVQNILEPANVDYQFLFWKCLPILSFNLAKFRAFFALFEPSRLFFGLGSHSKTFLEPTYIVSQLWFWKYSPIFLLLLQPNLGPFLPFLGLWGLFLGLRSGSKIFFGPTLCNT